MVAHLCGVPMVWGRSDRLSQRNKTCGRKDEKILARHTPSVVLSTRPDSEADAAELVDLLDHGWACSGCGASLCGSLSGGTALFTLCTGGYRRAHSCRYPSHLCERLMCLVWIRALAWLFREGKDRWLFVAVRLLLLLGWLFHFRGRLLVPRRRRGLRNG